MATIRAFGMVRQFSTSSARAALVNAPIQLFGTEGRYAHAVYSAAVKQKKLDQVEKELKDVEVMMQKNAKLAEFVGNPSVKRTLKREVMLDILKKQKFSDITVNLFAAMAENGRLGKTKGIMNAFGQIMSAYRGEVVCTVTTAKPLDAANQKEVEAALKMFLEKGQTLHMETKVDPTIIGGMLVSIDDKYVDMSTSKKIQTFTKILETSV